MPSENGLYPVKFRIGVRGWNAGEIAGFPRDLALSYVRAGQAELVNPEDVKELARRKKVVEEDRAIDPKNEMFK